MYTAPIDPKINRITIGVAPKAYVVSAEEGTGQVNTSSDIGGHRILQWASTFHLKESSGGKCGGHFVLPILFGSGSKSFIDNFSVWALAYAYAFFKL